MKGRFLFLGTGASAGVPLIGCKCPVCSSSSSFNKRLRSAGLLTMNGRHYVIDVGPDFRMQALTHHIVDLQGVLLTHAHSDHIAGIDDLRAYYFLYHKSIPCLLSHETFEEVKQRFPYLKSPSSEGSLSAQIDFHVLQEDFGRVDFAGIAIHYFTYFQAEMKVTGFRIGNFAYVSDIRQFSDQIFEHLKGVETLVLSALRHAPTHMHFSMEEAVVFSKRTKAKKTYFTHIAHDIDYEKTYALLPKGFHLAYDGLEIQVS